MNKMNKLIPCSSCRRHVRSSEHACPFCSAPTQALTARAQRGVTKITRAALFAGATFLLPTLPACGGQQSKTAHDQNRDRTSVPIDGGMPFRAVKRVEGLTSETPEELAERLQREQEALDKEAQELRRAQDRQQEEQKRQWEQRHHDNPDGVALPYGAPPSIDDLVV